MVFKGFSCLRILNVQLLHIKALHVEPRQLGRFKNRPPHLLRVCVESITRVEVHVGDSALVNRGARSGNFWRLQSSGGPLIRLLDPSIHQPLPLKLQTTMTTNL
jgi:hypothetical protein